MDNEDSSSDRGGPTGDAFCPYGVVRVLGSGASSVVYQASHRISGAEVALKSLKEGATSARRLHFQNEIHTLRRLRSRRVVRIHDSGPGANPSWFAMELLHGSTLHEVARGQRRPPWPWIREFGCQLLAALQAVHTSGVVHGDVKPSNCYCRGFRDFGSPVDVVLIDFGTARSVEEPLSEFEHTAATAAYLAPERRGGSPPTVLSDIYSAAVVVFELLTGYPPFGDGVPGSATRRPHPDLAVRQSDALKELPREAAMVLLSALDEQPERRPASARAFAELLRDTTLWSRGAHLFRRRDETTAMAPELALLAERVESMWIDGALTDSRAGFVDVRQGHRVLLGNEAHVSRVEIADAFEGSGRSMLLLGPPGFGKSVAALKVCRRLLDRRRRSSEPGSVPVVLPLHAWRAASRRWDEWLEQELRVRYGVPRRAARKMLEGRSLCLILDGLDEVPEHALHGCVSELNRWLEGDEFDGILVTCRTEPFERNALKLSARVTAELLPLDGDDVRVQLLGTKPKLAAELLTAGALAELTRTPLMLRLLQSLAGHASFEGVGAGALSNEKLVDDYVALHLKALRNPAEASRGIALLSRLALRDGQRILRSEGLQPNLLRSAWSRVGYVVLGRFAVAAIACFAPILAVIYSPLENDGFEISSAFAIELCLKGTLVAGGCYSALDLAVFLTASASPARKSLLAKALDSVVARVLTGATVIGGTALWVGFGNPPPVYAMGVEAGLLGVAALGLSRARTSIAERDIGLSRDLGLAVPTLRALGAVAVVAIALGFVAGTDSATAAFYSGASFGTVGVALISLRDRPRSAFGNWNTPVLRCLRSACVAALVAMIATTLVFGQSFGVTYGACVALTFVGGAFLWLGGTEVIYYAVLAALMRLEGQLPRQLRRVLEDAVHGRMMKRVGSGYAFIHDAIALRVPAIAAGLQDARSNAETNTAARVTEPSR